MILDFNSFNHGLLFQLSPSWFSSPGLSVPLKIWHPELNSIVWMWFELQRVGKLLLAII